MALIKKYLPHLLALSGITILYLVTRLYGLLDLPIFTDEAIYIRWAQIGGNDPEWRFISLTDGKQPLFIWLMMATLRIFQDPLFAGRIVSVGAGFLSMIGLFFLGKEIFKDTKIGIVAALAYTLYPFTLVYDKMALYDSLVATFFVWSIYFSVLLVKRMRLDIAMILGMTVGLATLNKSSGFFGVYLLPFSLALFNFSKKERTQRLLKWGVFALVAAVLTYAMYTILRLSPYFYLIDQKNTTFLYTTKEILEAPFRSFTNNLINSQLKWFYEYTTATGILLLLSSLVLDKKFIREKAYLLALFVVPLLGLAVFGRLIYPRYILFMTMPLIPLMAYGAVLIYRRLNKKIAALIVLVALALVPLYSMFQILTDFAKSPIPHSDKTQYLTAWPAGGGVQESIEYITSNHPNEDVYIATQGTFGLMPFAYEIYFTKNPNITVNGYWPIENEIPTEVQESSETTPTYFAFYQHCSNCDMGQAPKSWNATLVLEVPKGEGEIPFRLYRISNE